MAPHGWCADALPLYFLENLGGAGCVYPCLNLTALSSAEDAHYMQRYIDIHTDRKL